MFPFTNKMEMLIHDPCHTIPPDITIAETAKRMIQKGVDALVIQENSILKGIVTQSDLVQKVLAQEMSWAEPISKVMTSEIITIQKDQPVFDGLMLMIKHGIRHLLVLEKDNPTGIVSEHDWVKFQRQHPAVPVNDLEKAQTVAEVANLKKKAAGMARRIFEKEGNAPALITLFTEINDRATNKIIELCLDRQKQDGHGEPPVSFAWIGMGSEGRQAQTISTDQDNGIIFENVPQKEEKEVKQWFLGLAEKVVTGLEICGFPRCRGNIMATNPDLCTSLNEWNQTFCHIISTIDPTTLLRASIYFDFRHLYGKEELSVRLWETLLERIEVNKAFLRHLAGNMMVASRPPVNSLNWRLRTFFNMVPPSLDLKRQALAPLVDAVRILALSCGSSETNTLDRLDEILSQGKMNEQTVEAARDAYDFIMLLRIRHDFSGKNPEAQRKFRLNPKSLNPLQRNFLKDALMSISVLQDDTFAQVGGIDL